MKCFSEDLRPLIPLYIAMFLEAVGSGIVASVLTVVAREDLGCTGVQTGIILSSYNAGLMLGSVTVGYISDRMERQHVLVMTLLWMGGSYLFTAFASSFELFLASRIITGICGGAYPIAASILSSTLSTESLPKAVGRLGSMTSLGFAVGGFVSTAINAIWDVNTDSPYYIQRMYFFVTTVVYITAALVASRVSRGLTEAEINQERRSNLGGGPVTLGLVLIWVSRICSTAAVVSVYVTQVDLWRGYLGLARVAISLIMTASGIAVSLTQWFLYPWLVGKLGFHGALGFGIGLIGAACAAIGPATGNYLTSLHVICLVVFWVGIACMEPGTPVAVTHHLKRPPAPKRRWTVHPGSAMGITSAMKYGASLVFPPLAGFLFDNHSFLVYYCFSAVAFLGLMCVLLASRIYEQVPVQEPFSDKIEQLSVADSVLAIDASTVDHDRPFTVDRV